LNKSIVAYCVGIVAVALLSLPSRAAAVAAEETSGGALEEIVVTAQKREQNLQDVGVSVTAVSGDKLRELGIVNSRDIAKLAPGVVFDSTASGDVDANLTVRGISQSDYSSNQESPNAVYMDEIYMSASSEAAFTFYDLDRVELLRGPQGTLFGRNSTGGLVDFLTAKPTKNFEGYTQAGGGEFGEVFTEGAVSGPISDTVRFRLSGRDEQNSGWWKNYFPGGKNAFAKHFEGLRGQLEADLTDNLLARLTVSYDGDPRHREGTYYPANYYISPTTHLPAPQPANLDVWGTGPGNNQSGYRSSYPPGPQGAFNNVGFLANKRFSSTARLDWKLDSVTITSLANFTNFSFAYNEDCDGGPVDYCQFPFGQHLKQWSEELRATGTTGSLTWYTGVYYLTIDQSVYIDFLFPSLSGSSFAFSDTNRINQRTTSVAPFAQVEWKFADQFRLTVGARYTRDRKTFDSKVYFYELGNGYSGGTGSTVYNPPLLTYDYSKATVGNLATENNGLVSGKVQLDYTPTDGGLLYVGVSRGVKGAGFNTNVSGALTNAATPFGPETMYAYEVGEKFEFFDKHLRVNSSVFYYDYRNFQGFAFTGLQGVVGNYNGHFDGGEIEIVSSLPWRVLANLGVSYIDSLLHNVPTAYSGVRDEQGVLAPHWMFNGGLQKSAKVGPGTFGLAWDFNYQGDRYASVDNNPATFVKGSFMHNARITYDLDKQRLQFAVGVDNISNVARENFTFDLISSAGILIESYAPPRWWHASIMKKF
jgi:iron complex outermembrane receptor protein